MAINTQGIETVLEAAARGFAMGMQKRQVRERERSNIADEQFRTAEAEKRDKREADELKLRSSQVQDQIAYNKAQLDLAQKAAKLQMYQVGQTSREKASKSGVMPPNMVNTFNPSMPLAPGVQAINPETGISFDTPDFQAEATQRGKMEAAEQAPTLELANKYAMEQINAREASDQKQIDARLQSDADERKWKTEESAKDRALQREELNIRWGEQQLMKNLQLTDQRNARLARLQKLDEGDQKRLQANYFARHQISQIFDALEKTVSSGPFKGKKVKDAYLSEGIGNTLTNAMGRIQQTVTNEVAPEIATMDNLIQLFVSPLRREAFGTAVTPTEKHYADAAFNAMTNWRTNRTEAIEKLKNLRDAVLRGNQGIVSSLSPEQRDALDPSFRLTKRKKWVDDPNVPGRRMQMEVEE